MDGRTLKRRFTTALLVSAICTILLYLFLDYSWTTLFFRINRPSGLHHDDIRLFSQHAVNNTLIIIPSNNGMLHWVENLLCSLEATTFDASNLIFWALDSETKVYMDRLNRTSYHNPHLFATSTNENLRGDTAAYKHMMRERPKFYLDVLSSGFNILMLDADTIFFQSPLSIIPTHTTDNVDIIYSTDAREFYQSHAAFLDPRRRGPYMPPICNGIFYMRSSAQTLTLWCEMLDIFSRPFFLQPKGFYDDQRGMDVLLNDGRAQIITPFPDGIDEKIVPVAPYVDSEIGVRVRLLDQTEVANGHLLMNRNEVYERNLAKLRAGGKDRIAAHFNWWTEDMTKEEGAKKLGMYLLDENGQCRQQIRR